MTHLVTFNACHKKFKQICLDVNTTAIYRPHTAPALKKKGTLTV